MPPRTTIIFGVWLALIATLFGTVGGLAGQALATAPPLHRVRHRAVAVRQRQLLLPPALMRPFNDR